MVLLDLANVLSGSKIPSSCSQGHKQLCLQSQGAVALWLAARNHGYGKCAQMMFCSNFFLQLWFMSFIIIIIVIIIIIIINLVLRIEARVLHVLGKSSTSWAMPQPICLYFAFWGQGLMIFCPGWPQTWDSSASTSWVAGITSLKHHAWPVFHIFSIRK
jgi:hypothetical protein